MKLKGLVTGGALLLCLSAASAGNAQAQVVLNTSNWLPPNHVMTAGIMVPLCADMEKVTSGRVKCNILAKPLTGPVQTFDAVRAGVADFAYIVDGYTRGRFVLSQIAEFPFLGNTAETVSLAYHRTFKKYLEKADEHKGVKLVGVFTHGPGQLFTKDAINSAEDLRGKKIRTGGGLVNDIINGLGATGMFKSAPETYELMAAGIIDGFIFVKETPKSLNLIPLFKYWIEFPTGLYNVTWSVIMNPQKWAQISKADQAALEKLFGENLARRAGQAWDNADKAGVEAMMAGGIKRIPASPELVAAAKKIEAPLEAKWVDSAKARGIDGAAALKALREEIERISAQKQTSR